MTIRLNSLYWGDAVDVLSIFPKECIDLTVTSPPYDNLRDYKKFVFDVETIARELFRVTKQGGVVIWVVGDATVDGDETGTSFRHALCFKETGFLLHDTMIYAKSGFSNPSRNRYHQAFEFMFVFSKGTPKTFNPIKDRLNRWPGPWGRNTKRQKDGCLVEAGERKAQEEFGMRYNVWKYNVGKGNSTRDEMAYKHPAIFPEKLAEDHILSWSNPGDTVLDPMAGSGTTLKMAQKNCRNFIGIEISGEYCHIIKERVSLPRCKILKLRDEVD